MSQAVPNFVWAAAILYAVVVVGSWMLSRMGTLLVQSCRMVIGTRATMVLVDSPALFLHEMSHLIVALFFGHRIKEVKLTGIWRPSEGGHVITEYNPKKFRHRLGVSMMALAPIAFPMAILFMVIANTYGIPAVGSTPDWFLRILNEPPEQQKVPFLLLALYLHLLIAATMRLSTQDWLSIARGALSWAGLAVFIAALFYGGGPPWMWTPTVLIATCFIMAIMSKAAVLGILLPLAGLRRLLQTNIT